MLVVPAQPSRDWERILGAGAHTVILVLADQRREVPPWLARQAALRLDLSADRPAGLAALVRFFQREEEPALPAAAIKRSGQAPDLLLRAATRREIRLVSTHCLDEESFLSFLFDADIEPASLRGESFGARLLDLLHRAGSQGLLAHFTDWLELERGQCVRHRLDALRDQPTWSPQAATTSRSLGTTADPAAAPPGPIRCRWALLVGVDRYIDPDIPSLRFCGNDVLALEQRLQTLGYTVVCLHDRAPEARLPTRVNIEEELTRLASIAQADDLILVHFSGHGVLLDGQPLLLPREARCNTLDRTALPLAAVQQVLRRSPARRRVLLLDACHAGVQLGRAVADPLFIRHAHELAEGFALLAASTAEQQAKERRDTRHGAFTYSVIDALDPKADRGGKGFVTVDDLKLHVLDSLRRWNFEQGGRLQEPTAQVEGLGDMIVADFRPSH